MATYPLSERIGRYLTKDAKRALMAQCWVPHLSAKEFAEQEQQYTVYLQHYESVCQNVSGNDLGNLRHQHLVESFLHIVSKTHSECISALECAFDALPVETRNAKSREAFVSAWILLTGRVLLLLDLKHWPLDRTLREYLSSELFLPSMLPDRDRIPRFINLLALHKIAGLSIRWTDILSEHLMLERDNTQVVIFHQTQILDVFASSTVNPYPKSLLDETKCVRGLLLPRFERKCQIWFQTQVRERKKRAPGSSVFIDPMFATSKHMQPIERGLDLFPVFKDRLISLREEFDNHEPRTITQILRDNRRQSKRYGFIIAVIVFVFGAIQAVTGIIQVYKAYHPS